MLEGSIEWFYHKRLSVIETHDCGMSMSSLVRFEGLWLVVAVGVWGRFARIERLVRLCRRNEAFFLSPPLCFT